MPAIERAPEHGTNHRQNKSKSNKNKTIMRATTGYRMLFLLLRSCTSVKMRAAGCLVLFVVVPVIAFGELTGGDLRSNSDRRPPEANRVLAGDNDRRPFENEARTTTITNAGQQISGPHRGRTTLRVARAESAAVRHELARGLIGLRASTASSQTSIVVVVKTDSGGVSGQSRHQVANAGDGDAAGQTRATSLELMLPGNGHSISTAAAARSRASSSPIELEHKGVAISSARTSIRAERDNDERSGNSSNSEERRSNDKEEAQGAGPTIKCHENEASKTTTNANTKNAASTPNANGKTQVIDEIQTNVATAAASAADETKKYDDKRLATLAEPVKGTLAPSSASLRDLAPEQLAVLVGTARRQGAPLGAFKARTRRNQDAELGATEQETTSPPRNNLDELGERPASDQPSHGNSLAKMKLFAKTELLGVFGQSMNGADEQPVPANKEKPFASMINFALINGKANLACDIRAPSSDDSVALVLWYKDDSLAPIYTIDARKVNSLDRAKISVDDQYSSRLSFNSRTKPAQLELEQLKQDDEGDYRCRVDFKRGRTVNTIISLRIIIPPRELAIFMVKPADGGATSTAQFQGQDDSDELASVVAWSQRLFNNRSLSLVKLAAGGQIGPFNEGSDLELVCVAHGGKPRPELSWRRDFSVLNSTTNFASLDKDGTSVALRINSLQRQHLLSLFTCQASNNNLTSALQSSLTLDLNLKPKEVMIRQLGSHEGPLQVGQTATFECVTTGSRPQATIHWLFQGQRHDSPMNVDQQQTSSKLSLVLQRSFNQQPLTCVAENPRISSPAIIGSSPSSTSNTASSNSATAASKQTTIKLDVHYPPQLSVRLDRQNEKRQQAAGVVSASAGAESSSSSTGTGLASSTGHQKQTTDELNAADELLTFTSVLKNLQEGNDIYLTCQMDANPRPLKPIVWRFNGRQLVSSSSSAVSASVGMGPSSQPNQQQGTIVINNNSLVLRKVSRHQSGAYTCEASNQLGTNTSRPFELVIKHAPVCKTDDILVYEAAIGQLVSIDCQVAANPARSVQFAWFASYGSNQSLVDRLDRDTSLDEQLDNTSSQLKFRVRDEDSFALIKCMAKNEIGLQQRACLFQIVPAKEPELRHSCSLSGSSVQGLSLQCQLNDHLKTNQLQQWTSKQETGGHETTSRTSGSKQHDPLTWMREYNAMRQSLADSSSSESAAGVSARRLQQQQQQQSQWPRLRQIYPPDWLLVELYRAPSVSLGVATDQIANSSLSEELNPQSINYELQSYLIVGPNAQQLARVKSIVEENKLFQSNPRDIYYVATKTDSKQHQISSASDSRQQGLDELVLASGQHESDQLDLISQVDQSAPTIVKEAALRLPNAFNFSVPNLEPATRYKLLIYGQNLANKTRDWLVVRGETAPGQIHQTPAAAQKAVKNLVLDQDQADQGTNYSAPSQALGQSKSIVMRSEQAPDKAEQLDLQQQQQPSGNNREEPSEPTSLIGMDATVSNRLSSGHKLLVKIHHYKDQAFAYVKQKPLLTIPVALASCLVIVLIVVYLSGLFVNLVRSRTPTVSTSSDHSNDSSNSSSADSTTSRASSANQQNQSSGQKHERKDSLIKSSSTLSEDDRPRSCDKKHQFVEQQLDSLMPKLGLNCESHSFSSSVTSSFNGTNVVAAPNAIHPASVSLQHHHQDEGLPWDCLDAVALGQQHQMLARPNWRDQLTVACPTSTYSLGNDQMLGSLDRRGHFHPATTIYLAPDLEAPHSTISGQDGLPLVNGILQQSANWRGAHKHLAAGGSIDRRSLASSNERNGFILQEPQQQQYQPLFIPTNHHHEHVQQQQQQQQQQQRGPVPKSRARQRASRSSVQSQHRVAFDLSNQELGQHDQQQQGRHDDEYVTTSGAGGGLLQLTKCQGDSSSGSNNSTAANTADSGHESPATTGGETNSCQSGQHRRGQTIESASLARLNRQRQTTYRTATGTQIGAKSQDNGCNCAHKTGPGQQGNLGAKVQTAGGQTQLMLMEFASPSSQESSTFLQSGDSSFDANNINTTEQQDRPTAAYLLQQNYQMATSFASNQNSNGQLMMGPLDEMSTHEAENWL